MFFGTKNQHKCIFLGTNNQQDIIILGKILAIEVKSSLNTKAKSLQTITKDNNKIIGVKVTPNKFKRIGNLYIIPYYLLPFLDKVIE